jgi:putative redox protein
MPEVKLKLSLREGPFGMELSGSDGPIVNIDASPAIGGKGTGMRPMELLAGSLAGCMAIDVLNILRRQRIEPAHFEVGILGVRAEEVPSRFTAISLGFVTDPSVPIDKLERAIALSHEKYCSVAASLDKNIEIRTTINLQK